MTTIQVYWLFRPALLRNSPLSKALETRNIGWPDPNKFGILFCAVWSHDPSGLSVHAPHHFFSDPSPTARESASIILNCLWIVFTSLFPSAPHSVSLYVDMKMILSVTCSGSHCRSLIRLRIFSRRPNVMIPGNIFHSNSVGMPSIRFTSLTWLFSEYHLILLLQVAIGSSPSVPT